MKGQFSFTEDELKVAVLIVRDALLESIPSSSDIHYDLSESFIKKMNVLCIRARHNAYVKAVFQRVAMFFLATLIALGAWLAIDTDARANFFNWTKEIYENSTRYLFFTDADTTELPNYILSWLPDCFSIVQTDTSTVGRSEYYQNEKTGEGIFFVYHIYNTGFAPEVLYDNPDGGIQKNILINGAMADFYPKDESSNANVLIWTDESKMVWFSLSSDLDKSTIIRIAESVKLSDSTK